MSGPKLFLSIVWVFTLAAFFVPSESGVFVVARWVFMITLFAHVVECAVFFQKLKAAPGGLGHNLVQTLIFGVLHVQTLKTAEGSGEA